MGAAEEKKEVEEGEFFPTPRDVVYALFESPLVKLPGGRWIEPCTGTGRIIAAVNDIRDDVAWLLCELNPIFRPHIQKVMRLRDELMGFGDFVHRSWDYPMLDVLIMNPPFSLTMQFVQAAMERAHYVVCLQRRGWLGSTARSPWLSRHYPDTHHLSWRPSFRPDGQTDVHDYTWYIWPPEAVENRTWGISSMLLKPTANQMELFA